MTKSTDLPQELDHQLDPDQQGALQEFRTLVQIVAQLRGPNGCPWDKEQTQKSLTRYVLEEAFELVEAIEKQDQQDVKDELGDYLFQVILQAQVAKDEGHFSLLHVIQNLNEKMIRRHPHVFGEAKAQSSSEVLNNWDQIKAAEKAAKNIQSKTLYNYPSQMPSLQAAHKIGLKTEKLKFDWQKPEEVFEKAQEEVRELQEEIQASERSSKKLEHEIGDVLFSVAQLARHLKLDPEQCLRSANRRFEKRFNEVLHLSGVPIESFSSLSLEEKEILWRQAKQNTDREK